MDKTRIFSLAEVAEILGEEAATKLFEATEKDMRTEAVINLDFPTIMAGASVNELTMRRPKARDELTFAESKGSPAMRANKMLADLCSVAPADLQELDSVDYAKLEAQFARFKGAPSPRQS